MQHTLQSAVCNLESISIGAEIVQCYISPQDQAQPHMRFSWILSLRPFGCCCFLGGEMKSNPKEGGGSDQAVHVICVFKIPPHLPSWPDPCFWIQNLLLRNRIWVGSWIIFLNCVKFSLEGSLQEVHGCEGNGHRDSPLLLFFLFTASKTTFLVGKKSNNHISGNKSIGGGGIIQPIVCPDLGRPA